MNLPSRDVFGIDPALVVGVLSVLGAALVVLAPGLVPAAVASALAPLATEAAVVVLAAVAGVLGLRTVYRGEPRSDEAAVELPPPPAERERRREGGARTAGQSLDELLDRIGDPDRETRSIDRLIDKGQVRDAVRETALDVLADAGGYTREEADERLERGTWTDRPRAAAFLADRTLPLEVRIVDWFSGEAFERQVRAAVGELASVAGVETASGIAPDPAPAESGLLEGSRGDPAGSAATPGSRPTEDARAAAGRADEAGRSPAGGPTAAAGARATTGTNAAGPDGRERVGGDATGGTGAASAAGTGSGGDPEPGTDPVADPEPDPERTAAREGGSR